METIDEEKDPSVIPEDIKEFVRAQHKIQRESRPDEAWRIPRAQKPDAVAAPYKQDEDSIETGAQPIMPDDSLKMAKGGVVPGYADGAYPDIDPLLMDQGTGTLAPDPTGAQPVTPDVAPPPAVAPPTQPAVKASPAAPPPVLPPASVAPAMTDDDYAARAAKMLGTEPGQQSDILKSLGAAQQRGSFGTALAGIGDAIASGGTLGKVNPGAAARSQDLIENRTKQGVEGMQTLRENKEKSTELAQKLQAQDPNSPLSKYAQKAYGDVGKKIGIDLSHAPASLIADITGKGVSELNDEAELAVRKEGLDVQKGQLAQTIENNKAQRLHDEAVLAETAKDRAATQANASTERQTSAGKDIATRTLGRKITDTLFPNSATGKADRMLESVAAGAKGAGMAPDVLAYAQKHNITPEQAQAIKDKRTGGQ